MTGANTIQDLLEEVGACRICLDAPRGRPLPHEPRPVLVPSATARVLIAGQAPGTKVHASGIPFNDASGDRLRDWMGVTCEEFYDSSRFAMLPMGFCFPGQDAKGSDLAPRRECAPAWRAKLIELMPQIELVLAIGGYAQAWHLGARRLPSLTETVESWRAIHDSTQGQKIIPLPHPSWRNSGWLKKHPWFETDLLPFLKTEIRRRMLPQM